MLASFSPDVKILATITLPYTDPEDPSIFASIHSNPPGIPTSNPAMVYGNYGKGKVVWVASSIETMNSDASEQVVMSAIKKLHKPEILSTNAPSCVEFTLFDDKVNNRFILHAVNVSETREILPVHDIEVSLCLTRKINNAYFIPSLKPVKVSDNVGSISFKIDKLEIAEHLVFEY